MERLPNERKKGGGCAQPYARDTIFQDSDRGDGFEKDTSQKYFFTCVTRTLWKGGGEGDRGEMGGTRAGYKGERGGVGIRPTTNDQSRGVMRHPLRDPMRGVDLMVLGYVGASTASHVAPGNRGFSSQAAPGNQLPD